jgi:integrase
MAQKRLPPADPPLSSPGGWAEINRADNPPPSRIVVTPAELARIGRQLDHSKAKNTRRAYAADLRKWRSWCHRRGVPSIPASVESLVLFVSEQAAVSRPTTIERCLSAIAEAHELAGVPREQVPTRNTKVRLILSGVKRCDGRRVTKKAAADRALLKRIIESLPSTLIGLRDKALFLVGFCGAFRRSEFVKIRVEDLEWFPDGAVVHLGRTKTDQEGTSSDVPIRFFPEEPEMCPLTTLRAWLTAAGITSGFVFRGECLNEPGKLRDTPLSADWLGRRLKTCIALLGLDARAYGAHSLRAGFVTQAVANGASIPEIQAVTRHRDPRTVMGYFRAVDPFRDTAANKIHKKSVDPVGTVRDEIRKALQEAGLGPAKTGGKTDGRTPE